MFNSYRKIAPEEPPTKPEVESSTTEFSSVEVERKPSKEIPEEKSKQVKPSKPIWTKFLETIFRPLPQEIDEAAVAEYRRKVAHTQRSEKERRLSKRKKKAKKKARRKEKERSRSRSKSRSKSAYNMVFVKGSDGILRSLEHIKYNPGNTPPPALTNASVPTPSPNRSSSMIFQTSSTSVTGGVLVEARRLQHAPSTQSGATGPTHVSAGTRDLVDMKKLREQRRRRISQLYSGRDVYHHSLDAWDHENSKFNTRLDEAKRKKYPITEKIQKKMDKIRDIRFKKGQKRELGCLKWSKKKFFKTALGLVFHDTPRYYKMTPVVPKYCRRCRNKLEDTLETRWTPVGIAFAILFPILGILCCLANREFVCVVCEEIYVYGDYPSKCKPMNDDGDSDDDVILRKNSFLRSYKY